jgi:hypothetical protein
LSYKKLLAFSDAWGIFFEMSNGSRAITAYVLWASLACGLMVRAMLPSAKVLAESTDPRFECKRQQTNSLTVINPNDVEITDVVVILDKGFQGGVARIGPRMTPVIRPTAKTS